jgi:hypothetical protein
MATLFRFSWKNCVQVRLNATGDKNAESKVVKVEKAKPAPLEHFDLVAHSFRRAIAGTMIKVVQDVFPPIAQGLDESLQRSQGTGFHSGNPILQPELSCLAVLQIKDGPELVFQVMAKLQFWGSGIEFGQTCPFFVTQVLPVLDHSPATAVLFRK